jgi:hypothetical protein
MSTPWVVAFAALCILVVTLGVIVLGLLRQALPLIEQSHVLIERIGSRLRRFGLPAGMVVPAFTAETIEGEIFTDRELRGRMNALLFVGSSCPACSRIYRDLADGHIPHFPAGLVVIVDEADAQDLSAASDNGVTVLTQRRGSIATIFESDRIPHLFVLDENAAVRLTGSAAGWDDVADLVAAAQKGGGPSEIPAVEIPAAAMASSEK